MFLSSGWQPVGIPELWLASWSTYPRESTRGRRIQPQKLDKVTVRPALQSKQSPGTGVNDVPGLDIGAASEIRTPDLRITAVMPLAGCEWTAR